MTLSVVGAGFGRTGTMSIKLALEQVGLGPCHHMEEVLLNPEQLPFWQAAAAGNPVSWTETFEGYNSAIDWPSAHYWRELIEFYPNAKVILSVRPVERWWQSFSGTICKIIEMRSEVDDPHVRGTLEMGAEIIAEQTFGGAMSEAPVAQAAFEQRIADVQAAVPSHRLLTFDVTEGWEPFCQFLDCSVPEGPFPRSHAYDEFWAHFDEGNDS